MKLKILEKEPLTVALLPFTYKITYTGEEIKPLWSLRALGLQGDSLVIFNGPLRVEASELVDMKDFLKGGKEGPVICADEAVSMVIEHFDQQPPSLRLMYHRLRILAFLFRELVEETCDVRLTRKGTDFYFEGGKLNVGVATVSPSSGKIHFAFNISSKGAPPGIKIASLLDLGLKKEDVEAFTVSLARRYRAEILDIDKDVAKSRTF
ncbi:MAG: DUF366 family protein [Candidatus Freyarchaeota archaeon]|nr:DUF366 family protein [Candidatus Jordarchaeia archaeon]